MLSLKTSKKEILIIVALLIVAVGFYAYYTLSLKNTANTKPTGIYAEIIYDGILVDEVSLLEDKTFSVPEMPYVVFEVKNNKIAFIDSDCPDKVCVHTGWLDSKGHFASCLPNRIIVFVVDDEGTGIDSITR